MTLTLASLSLRARLQSSKADARVSPRSARLQSPETAGEPESVTSRIPKYHINDRHPTTTRSCLHSCAFTLGTSDDRNNLTLACHLILNMDTNAFPPPQSVDEVAQLVKRLYQPGNPEIISQIQNQLQTLQRSNDGWQLADALLGYEDINIRFFGALTFTVKLNNDGSVLLPTLS